MRTVLAAFVVTTLATATRAQDMVAVGWSGRVYALDSATGALAELAIGPMGANGLARDSARQLWSTARLLPDYWLTRVDAVAGTVAYAHPSVDLRGLAEAGPGQLWGVESRGAASWRLWRIDTATGVHTLVGDTGTTVIQGLAVQQGVLYGWHLANGLVVIDPQSGAASDPFAFGTGGHLVQWLAADPAGGLIGGSNGSTAQLLHIDTATGVVTGGPGLPASADLRGAEFASFALPYGSGCSVGSGPLELRAAGDLAPGLVVTLSSRNHLPQTLKAIAIGLSRTSWQGQALPFLLDPLTGSSGCSLYVSLEMALLLNGSAFPTPVMAMPLAVPAAWGVPVTLFAQQFDFNQPWNPPGSSNGLVLHVRP